MKGLICGITLLLTHIAYSATAPNNISLLNAPNAYLPVNSSESLKALKDPSFLNYAFPSMEEVAKRACGYKIKPQSITVSIGIISVTWDTEKLCK